MEREPDVNVSKELQEHAEWEHDAVFVQKSMFTHAYRLLANYIWSKRSENSPSLLILLSNLIFFTIDLMMRQLRFSLMPQSNIMIVLCNNKLQPSRFLLLYKTDLYIYYVVYFFCVLIFTQNIPFYLFLCLFNKTLWCRENVSPVHFVVFIRTWHMAFLVSVTRPTKTRRCRWWFIKWTTTATRRHCNLPSVQTTIISLHT